MNDALGQLMRSKGYTYYKMSKVSGLPLTTVATLGRGERLFKNATVENALKIAQVLDMTIEEIYTTIYGSDSDV